MRVADLLAGYDIILNQRLKSVTGLQAAGKALIAIDAPLNAQRRIDAEQRKNHSVDGEMVSFDDGGRTSLRAQWGADHSLTISAPRERRI
jgi:hypothetical protein